MVIKILISKDSNINIDDNYKHSPFKYNIKRTKMDRSRGSPSSACICNIHYYELYLQNMVHGPTLST